MQQHPLIAIAGKAGAGKDTFAGLLQIQLAEDGELYKIYSFAAPIYEAVSNILQVSVDVMKDRDEKELEREIVLDAKEFRYRFDAELNKLLELYGRRNPHQLLELLASEGCYADLKSRLFEKFCEGCGERFSLKSFVKRNKLLRTSYRKMLQYYGTEIFRDEIAKDFWTAIAPKENVIIPDCRFENECEWVRFNDGIVVKVVCPSMEDISASDHPSEQFVNDMVEDYTIVNNKAGFEDLQAKVKEFIHDRL